MAKSSGKSLSRNDILVRKVSKNSRIADAIMAVIFLGLAIYYGWWLWWASFALCVITATTAPIDKLYAFIKGRFIVSKKPR